MFFYRFGVIGTLCFNKNKDKIADLGTGTGIIPLLLSALGAKDIAAFEINPIMADIAKRNVSGNKKNDIIKVLECDYKKD